MDYLLKYSTFNQYWSKKTIHLLYTAVNLSPDAKLLLPLYTQNSIPMTQDYRDIWHALISLNFRSQITTNQRHNRDLCKVTSSVRYFAAWMSEFVWEKTQLQIIRPKANSSYLASFPCRASLSFSIKASSVVPSYSYGIAITPNITASNSN